MDNCEQVKRKGAVLAGIKHSVCAATLSTLPIIMMEPSRLDHRPRGVWMPSADTSAPHTAFKSHKKAVGTQLTYGSILRILLMPEAMLHTFIAIWCVSATEICLAFCSWYDNGTAGELGLRTGVSDLFRLPPGICFRRRPLGLGAPPESIYHCIVGPRP